MCRVCRDGHRLQELPVVNDQPKLLCQPFTPAQDETCLAIDHDGQSSPCWQCAPNLIFDHELSVCKRVGVQNCLSYHENFLCKQCKSTHVLKQLECEALSDTPDQVIPNCALHQLVDGKLVCAECNPNFFLGHDGACLVRSSGVLNCYRYNGLDECSICVSGFLVATATSPSDPSVIIGTICQQAT